MLSLVGFYDTMKKLAVDALKKETAEFLNNYLNFAEAVMNHAFSLHGLCRKTVNSRNFLDSVNASKMSFKASDGKEKISFDAATILRACLAQ